MAKTCLVNRPGPDKLLCKNTLHCFFALQNGKFSRLGGDSLPYSPLSIIPTNRGEIRAKSAERKNIANQNI